MINFWPTFGNTYIFLHIFRHEVSLFLSYLNEEEMSGKRGSKRMKRITPTSTFFFSTFHDSGLGLCANYTPVVLLPH